MQFFINYGNSLGLVPISCFAVYADWVARESPPVRSAEFHGQGNALGLSAPQDRRQSLAVRWPADTRAMSSTNTSGCTEEMRELSARTVLFSAPKLTGFSSLGLIQNVSSQSRAG